VKTTWWTGSATARIADLSLALPGSSFVISRSTVFTYRDRRVGIRQVGPELAVLYMLERSVLADPHRVRVNIQLIDAIRQQRCGVG
jgi:TolB-like protein